MANGILKIEVDTFGLAAVARFEPTPEGDAWTVEKVRTTLAERGVQDGIDSAKINELIKRGSEGPVTIQVASGTAPREPVPETVIWAELGVPEELAAVIAQVLATSPTAEITRQITERVKREKEVEKKGGIPFGRPKTETVTVVESVTRVEKVYIDPTVERSAYVIENQVVGRVKAREPGIAGLSVTGRVIPVKQLADGSFYAGAGLTRRGDELIVARSGILRIGRNWADVVPYQGHEWTIELSPDQATCYLTIRPGHRLAPIPQGVQIRAVALELPYPDESLVGVAEIDELVRRAVAERKTIEKHPISHSRDASFDIFITDDKLSALLNIHKGKGRGKPLNLKEVGTAIKQSGLRKLDLERIRNDVSTFYNGPEFDLTGYLLCEGQPAIPGPDRQFELGVRFHSEAETRAVLKQLNSLIEGCPEAQSVLSQTIDSAPDFLIEKLGVMVHSLLRLPPAAIQKTAMVTVEQLIASIDPAVPGTPGTDVYGNSLPAPEAGAPTLVLLDNVTIKNGVVVPTIAGILDYAVLEGRTMLRVRPHQDCTVSVVVTADRKSAALTLSEGKGSGRRLTVDEATAALNRANVKFGVESEILEKAIAAAAAGMAVRDLVIARAREPVHQTAGQVKWLVTLAKGNEVRIRADGTADYRNQDRITTVEPDTVVCALLPSQLMPEDGVDVTGQKIPALVQTGPPIQAGQNIRTEDQPDGAVHFIATAKGEIRFEKGILEVRTVFLVKGDVDMHVGNIKFPGAVTIGGNVLSGFAILAGGDIQVAGSVDAALLSSDGDIMIKQGVKGNGKAVLRSKGRVLVGFLELCTVLAVGDVLIKSASVRSRIKCNGRLSLGDKSRIVGGVVRVRHGLEVAIVGSPRGIPTQISFGQDYLIADLMEKEEQEIAKIKRRITAIDIEMRQAERQHNTTNLEALRREKVNLLKFLEKRGLRLFTLRERFEEHFESSIVIKEVVYSGTVFESHGRTYEIKQPRKGLKVAFNRETGNIDVADLKNGS